MPCNACNNPSGQLAVVMAEIRSLQMPLGQPHTSHASSSIIATHRAQLVLTVKERKASSSQKRLLRYLNFDLNALAPMLLGVS